MREIKFRAWDKKEKRMRIVAALKFGMKEVLLGESFVGGVADFFIETVAPQQVDKVWSIISAKDCEVMQFTGLKDGNGREIYEEDVVRLYGNALAEVKWVDAAPRMIGFGAFEFKRGDERVIDTADVKTFAREMARAEVIGNIYENSELLK
jgi:uncharacterized phage protein (TIGR01671 family)